MNERITATINDHQILPLAITPKDRDGDVVDVENVVWTSSDTSIVTVQPEPDGLTCFATSTGAVGEATVTCTADADLGDGVQAIEQECLITVVQSNAESLNMSTGVPIERSTPETEPLPEGGGETEPPAGE